MTVCVILFGAFSMTNYCNSYKSEKTSMLAYRWRREFIIRQSYVNKKPSSMVSLNCATRKASAKRHKRENTGPCRHKKRFYHKCFDDGKTAERSEQIAASADRALVQIV